MAQTQDPKGGQPDHTNAAAADAQVQALPRRRPVPHPPKCGRDALAGYAVGATVGTTLAFVYFVTRHPVVSAPASQYLWRGVAYGGIPGVAAAEFYHAMSATQWWADVEELWRRS